MGRDRFVRWDAEPPSREVVLATAREFFGPDAIETAEGEACVTFSVPMDPSAVHHPLATYKIPCDSPRAVEIHFHPKTNAVNVETRGADAFTNCLADELAAHISWYYDGTIDEGVSRREYAHFAGEPFWQKRADALTRALEMLARGGIERALVDAYLDGNGRWEKCPPDPSAPDVDGWFHERELAKGKMAELLELPAEPTVALARVAEIAQHEGRNLASVLETMMAPPCGEGDDDER